MTKPAGATDPALILAILDLAADAIITVGKDDRILSWNRGARQMLGWTEEEVVGRDFSMLLPEEELARGEHEWLNREVRSRHVIRDFETRRRTKDGRIVEVSLTRTGVLDESGDLIGYSAILRDISERRRVERQMLKAERLATAGQVAAGVAHEIGAPLTAISMAVEQMLRQRCGVCEGAQQMRLVQSQVDRIAHLARQLVDLAKPAAMTTSPVHINDLVTAAAGLLQPQFFRKGARIDLTLDQGLGTILVDGAQLQQVLLNVLLNAHRAVPEGTGVVVIRTGRGESGSTEIVIEDNGTGIAAEDLPHLFTAFFSRSGGSGLGLALAAQIVQAHGGTIEAAHAPGGGARFSISLPSDNDD
jgi:PAS domain S-box-containing protein